MVLIPARLAFQRVSIAFTATTRCVLLEVRRCKAENLGKRSLQEFGISCLTTLYNAFGGLSILD